MKTLHCIETFRDKRPNGNVIVNFTGRAACGVSAEPKDGAVFIPFRLLSKKPMRDSLCVDCLECLEL